MRRSYYAVGYPAMPDARRLRDANEIGAMRASANDQRVCRWQMTVSCGRRSVDASRTWLFATDGPSPTAVRTLSRMPVQITGKCMMRSANVVRCADAEGVCKMSALYEQ